MRTLLATMIFPAILFMSCAPAASHATGPALWSISDEDSTVWLFGTAHLLRPDIAWRTPRIEAALSEAEALYLETDVSPAAAPRLQALAALHGTNPPGVTLSALLDADANAKLASAAERFGLQASQFEPVRPWLVALQLSVASYAAEGATAEAGVERVLSEHARAAQKHFGYLETPEEQIAVLADLPQAAQIAFLVETLNDIESGEASMSAMEDAWARGDIAALRTAFDNDLDGMTPEVREAMLTARNRRWVDEIVALLNGDDDVFVAVGAAHLVGDDSVIDLLRERGLTVQGP